MSEFQYYEFLGLDRPLSAKEMTQLRAVSSRATITPTSFSNHYEWGDLKADPLKLLERYFDVFVYVANWNTRWIALRVPKGCIETKQARRYLVGDTSGFEAAGDVWILSLSSDDGDPEDDFDDGSGWMASLAPVRADLLRGDLRPLYVAWLATAQEEALAEDSLEPPVPLGLGHLTPAQVRLAEFLRVDEYLFAAAADGSPTAADSTDGIDAWIAALPPAEKDRMLVAMAQGNDGHVGADLFRRFHAQRPRPATPPQRTVGALLAEARRRRERDEQEQARLADERRRREAEEAARARESRLNGLAQRQEAAWHDVDAQIMERKPDAYESAASLLLDLQEVAHRSGAPTQFRSRLTDLAQQHRRKVTLMEKLRKAQLIA